jgi:L-amino acid N-acyltransferase YncA
MRIRHADAARDGAACAAIYAPAVLDGVASFEEVAPTASQMTQRILTTCAGIALPNPGSVALHESLGFTPVGVYREIGFKFDRWCDVGWWQRALRDRDRDPSLIPAPPGTPGRLPNQ